VQPLEYHRARRVCILLLPGLLVGLGTNAARADDVPATPQSTTATLMEEITVTARRREENIQDTPISIAAYSGAALEARGIDRADDLAKIVPNLVFQQNPGAGGSESNAAVFIRGVGQSDFIPTVDPGVGLYVDGVYVARSVGSLLDLVDIDRVEVLRGPQGTLFGRNTIGGAVSVVTQKPTFDAVSGTTSALYGTDNRVEVKTRLNMPLTSSLAASVSAAVLKQGGYVDQVATGEWLGNHNDLVGKLAVRWKGDNQELNFAVDGTRTRENGPAFVLKGVNFQSGLFNPQNLPLLPPGSPQTPGFYTINPPADIPSDNFSLFNNYFATLITKAGNCLGLGSPTYNPAGDQKNPACYGPQYTVGANQRVSYGTLPSYSNDNLWGIHLTYDWDITDTLRLKSITAFRHLQSAFQRDGDESPLVIYQLTDELTQHQFSEELQLEGESFDKALKWVGGLYYFTEDAVNPNTVNFAPVEVLSGGEATTNSIAGFAQGTYDLTTQWSFTAGGRYTRDRKTFTPNQYVLDSKGGPFPDGLPVLPSFEVGATFSKFTPMANVSYHFNPNAMLYATYSQGFKSGGFTQRVFPPLPATPSFGPESVTSYEIGLKTSGLDNRFHVNVAAYRANYDDIQVQIFQAIAPITANGGQGRIQGFEFETQVSPGAGWFFEANAGFTDAGYTRIDPAAIGLTLESQFAFVSRWSGMVATEKEFQLGNLGRLSPRVQWTYRSSYFNDALNTPFEEQRSYGLVDASVKWNDPNSKYSANVGVKNAFNKAYDIAAYFTPGSGPFSVIPDRGRQWYVSVKMDY
jgi:iron complex outermembrane recepter protein